MDNGQDSLDHSEDSRSLPKEVERLSAENLLLRQRTELEHLWSEDREKQREAFVQHKAGVEAEINKRLVELSLVGLIVVGAGWWSVSQPIRQTVQERLDKEFASDNIRSLISEAALHAAQSQTSEMMNGTLKPAVNEAMDQIQKQKSEVKTFTAQFRQQSGQEMGQIRTEVDEERKQERHSLEELRQEYTKQIDELRPLVKFQEELKGIDLLKDHAVNGEFSAYSQLASYKSADQDLMVTAQSAVIEVKEAYLVGKRTSGVSIWMNNADGTRGLSDEQIPTTLLTSTFLLNGAQQWQFRTRSAEILASRREAGVAEALLKAMQSDGNLWVRRTAFQSFEALTGYREVDVFDFAGASGWWEQHKAEYLKSIAK